MGSYVTTGCVVPKTADRISPFCVRDRDASVRRNESGAKISLVSIDFSLSPRRKFGQYVRVASRDGRRPRASGTAAAQFHEDLDEGRQIELIPTEVPGLKDPV